MVPESSTLNAVTVLPSGCLGSLSQIWLSLLTKQKKICLGDLPAAASRSGSLTWFALR